ncbi:hypothetical protein PUMCH_005169 [Australozyma saopauloensis]|uniref:FAD-binding FR-type domain-containing protein n=1 Tax=Australozyma saopauloensis TaxID=291208 RepID=A0AAX4HH63_9ASCO|nr:hypothetical protein PUMCH_005169 [[Candida] saopauloensis]
MNLSIFFALYFLVTGADAFRKWHPYGHDYLAHIGCGIYISRTVTFADTKNNYIKFCNNRNGLATMVGCLADANYNSTRMLRYLQMSCMKDFEIEVPWENYTTAYSYLLQSGVTLKLLRDRKYNSTKERLKTPVYLNKTMSTLYVKAEQHYLDIYSNSMYYGIGTVAYWGLVCVIGAIANWSMILFPSLRIAIDGRVSKLWRKWVTLPALFGKKKTAMQRLGFFSMLIPSRIESIVSLLFIALLIAVNAAELHFLEGDPIFKNSRKYALIKYFSIRTGVVCTVLIPVLLLFGGRNNFLMWLTRWKYSTFVAYHRWIGRWVVLMAFLHSVGYTEVFIIREQYAEEMAENYVIWGVVGTVCGCLILFQGLLYLRRNWYETFLVIHILLAVFFVVGTWYHVIRLGYGQIMFAAVAVWGFDRIVRIARIMMFGFPEAQVTLLKDKLEVIVPRPRHWKPIVGGYVWIYFGDMKYFWQAHPFTYMHDENNVMLYCTVHSGVTEKIAKKLRANPSGPSMKMRVTLEGPYGTSSPIEHHSDVVFVAGGNGIPGMLNEFKHLLKKQDCKQRLQLNWIIREAFNFEEMAKYFAELPLLNAEVNIYITRPASFESPIGLDASNDGDYKTEAKSDTLSGISLLQSDYPELNFFSLRPDMNTLVQKDIDDAANSVAFVTCGPAVMVDELRAIIVEKIDLTKKRVDFYDTVDVWN